MDSNETSICPLCRHEKVKIFAVGDCSHPVCYLCSTKMRILCEQTYCAICRQDLSRVYFVSNIADNQPPFDQSRFIPIDGTGDCGIYYPTKFDWIRRESEKLLRNFCPFCHNEYETFEILRNHVQRSHHYFYCDLCYEHLNLFPFERKCYTRQDLVQHIRYGDRDDKSFKGHPLCRFCDDHFLDVDQLYKHMRKEHYYCHLCENDNIYYSDFDLLRDHYRSNHYICEIGQCKEVQFTNVFPSEIEFRAHQAAQHSKNRAEARQLGTIPVEFQMTTKQTHDPARRGTFRSGEFKTQGGNITTVNEREEIRQEPAVAVTVPSIDEFPTLNEGSSSSHAPQRGAWSNDVRGIHSSDDFPALTAASNTTTGHPRGIWREQQQQAAAPVTQSVTSKKATQPTKPITNGIASMNMKEDFPALGGATNARIPPPVSLLSAWSTAKKSAKNATNNARANQPQTRMNTNRLMYDNEDEEYIRRPMSSLTTSTQPAASSNITMITSADISNNQVNDKQTKTKNQSVPNAHDFPALPTLTSTQNNPVTSSGIWTASTGSNSPNKVSDTQQKKKPAGMSKKKFMQEINAIPTPPSLSSMNDFPAVGLSELGRRLIADENQPVENVPVKEEKSSSPSHTTTSTSASNKQEKKSTNQSNKKTQKPTKINETQKQETVAIKEKEEEVPVKSVPDQLLPKPPVRDEPISQVMPPPVPLTQPPPGFSATVSLPPPPGFNTISSSDPIPSSFIYHTSYSKQKDEFRAKLLTLFDGDTNLFIEYDQFCEAFSQKNITSKDFIKFTSELFKDKLDEYLLEFIVIIPNIEQQNELYNIWENDIHPSSTTTTTKSNTNSWIKKNINENNIYKCRVCQQIMFENNREEHESHHTEFNTQFPSLPNAALPIGRGNRKKKT